MRILFCIIMLLVPSMTITVANGVNELDYHFYVVPTVEPEIVKLEIVLENTGDVPLHFEFPTSQLIEMTITDNSGKEVYDYSKGRYFLQAFQTASIKPHQTFKRVENWNYQFKGSRVSPGEYTVHTTFRPIRLNDEPITNRAKLRNVQKFIVPEMNHVFRNIKVSGTNGDYIVTGETKAAYGNGYYTVEDGHKQYINETKIELTKEEAEWRAFQLKVHLPKENLPPNGSLIMNLYERGKEGEILQPYPVVLEQFQ